MLDWLDARAIVLQNTPVLPSEAVPLDRACGRVLAEDFTAALDLPPFDNSAVDGFGVRSGDVASAKETSPVKLRREGVIAAGSGASLSVEAGHCVQLFTGARIPSGVDAVVMQEVSQVSGDSVLVRKAVHKGENVRRAGEDVEAGHMILKAGTLLTPARIGVLASQGCDTVRAHRVPRVGLFATGEEIVEPGAPRRADQIFESNTHALSAALSEIGVSPAVHARIPDTAADTKSALAPAFGNADVLIVSGGVSVGAFDFVKPVLEELGVKRLFWRVALKPGKPLYFGVHPAGTLVFGLPGNPVSTLVCFYEFIRPAALKMMGHTDLFLREREAVLEHEVERLPGRFEFMRGFCREEKGEYSVRSAGRQGSHIYSSFAAANCFILIPADVKRLEKGDSVSIQILPPAQ